MSLLVCARQQSQALLHRYCGTAPLDRVHARRYCGLHSFLSEDGCVAGVCIKLLVAASSA
jgi:hypothetical protein